MRLLNAHCCLCGREIDDDRIPIRKCGPCTIQEMIDAAQPPGAKCFEPFVCENLYKEPVVVRSSQEFKDLQKLAKCTHIGDDGQKETVARIKDRSHGNIAAQERAKREAQTYKGTLPPGWGKKKPYDPKLDQLNRHRHDKPAPVV